MRRRHRRSRGVRSGPHDEAVLSIDVRLRLSEGTRDRRSSRWTIPILKKVKIGVHLLGDDYTNPPPVHELSKRGVVGNLVGFSTFYSAENPPSAIIDAVASGKVDVAIVWGPAAGYFVKQQRVPLAMVPVPSGKGDLPFEFGMSMGVKPGNDALRLRLEKVIDSRRAEITKILKDYNIPLVEKKAGPTR